MLSPTWGGGNTNNANRDEIMNNAYQARTELESKAQSDYYAAKKQSEIQSSMFGGTALANTPNLNTDSGQRTATAKALTTFGLSLLTGGLAGVPVGVAAAMGLNQAAKGYGRDMNRSYRLNKALSGDLDQYTDMSIQDWVMSGDSSKLKLLEEENSQIRKFNERPTREQYVGSKEVFENITGLEATTANGWQGAGMYSQQWDSFSNKYEKYTKSDDTRQAEEAIRKSKETPVGGTGADDKLFSGGEVQFIDPNGNTVTLYRTNNANAPFRDSGGNPVNPTELGLREVNQTNIDIARKLMTDPSATASQREWAAQILQAEELAKNERGNMSPTRYEGWVQDIYRQQSDMEGIDTTISHIDSLLEGDTSRLGQRTVNIINGLLEPLNTSIGDPDLRKKWQAYSGDKLELTASLVRAFAPVSDTAMNLVETSLEGATLEAIKSALESTKRRIDRDYDYMIKEGQSMKVPLATELDKELDDDDLIKKYL